MKKQFFRVKQLADQTFSRAGKTEVLSDDLVEADRKVEYLRTACSNISKKIAHSLVGQGLGHDAVAKEKKLKKIPEYVLSLAMQDSGAADEDCLFRNILAYCSKVEGELANEVLQHDTRVEDLVNKMQQMLEPEVPNIMKHKRNLAKLILDMDSARTRHQTAVKHSAGTGASRIESIKEELEDAETKVEQCRDHLASEMFQLLAKEAEFAGLMLQHIELQRTYHENALKVLEDVIPDLQATIDTSSSKPVYGIPLEEHLRVTGRKIAFPIELCVCALLELGMEEEGLFRVAGGASKLRRMKMSFDACCLNLPIALEYRDPHVIAGALKSYLRDLPEPLLTYRLYEEWMSAARMQMPNDARLQALWQVVHKLPTANFDNLQYLIKFLATLTKNQEVNKMTPQNIAIVIAPNLIWSADEESNTMGMNMNSANLYNSIVDNLISFADWFFPNEIEFCQTMQRELGLVNGGMSVSFTASSGNLPQDISGSPGERGYGHTRSSSGEGQLINVNNGGDMKRTQSNSSLSDHSSPPQGSPKPAARRKNKPAPVPPPNITPAKESIQHPSEKLDKPDKPPRPSVPPIISSTLPRPSKKHADVSHELKQVVSCNVPDGIPPSSDKHKQSSSAAPIAYENFAISPKAFESEQHQIVTHCSSQPKCSDKPSVTSVRVNCEPASSSEHISHILSNVAPSSSGQPQKVNTNYSNSTLERKPAPRSMPVAAPRSVVSVSCVATGGRENHSVADSKTNVPSPPKVSAECAREGESASVNHGVTEEGVTLRRSSEGDRSQKPAVPERPATLLRPHSSFRGSRGSADSDISVGERAPADSDRPMLERTHMYSVDKQQVSIIQVGGDRERPVPVPLPCFDSEPALVRSPSVGGRPLSMTLLDEAVCLEKPEMPTKPDNVIPTEKQSQQPSHSRTKSEGNICDISSNYTPLKSPTSPRILNRPPRPQPPPPPPPTAKTKREKEWESTDL